jgi:hypothetical protein
MFLICLVHGCRDTQHIPFPAHACGAFAEGTAVRYITFGQTLIVFFFRWSSGRHHCFIRLALIWRFGDLIGRGR